VPADVFSQESSLSNADINRQQAESLYCHYILPEVEKVFNSRDGKDGYEAPIIGIINVLDVDITIDEVLNFLCYDPYIIPEIIERGNALEFTKIIDLLLNRIKNTSITEIQSHQAFSVLDKLYKKLPEVAHIQPSLYGKMHTLFSLLLNDNRKDIIHTLTEAMTSDNNKKYFNLYINNDGAIENDYLNLILKIYASSKENQESDYRLFEKLISFLGKHDFIETKITSAKALHLANSISDIVLNFDEAHQSIFIEYFLDRKIDGDKFDEMLVQTLDQEGLLEKHHCIKNKKDISKISQYKVVDYLAHQDRTKASLNEIGNTWLLDPSISDKKQQLLAMIDHLDIYNCHSIVNYLSAADDMVYKEVIASKSSTIYEHMIDLLVTKLQGTTTISNEDSDKMADLLMQLYRMLPFIGTQSRSLCGNIYKAFNLLIPQSINLISGALQASTNRNPDFYFPLSISKNKKVTNEFLELVAKIYKTPTDNYELLDELLEDIKINVSNNSPDYKLLFITEKLYKIIISLPDAKQSMVIKSLLDTPEFAIDIKNYLYVLFNKENINIPDCNFQPLDQLSIEFIKQKMELIKVRDPYFFSDE
jgi:hypothetical protein